MKDRIRQLMESQHMTQQTFSDFIGISSASLSSIFTGRTKPTLNTVEAIRSKFTKINLDWLMGQEADAASATSGMGTVHSAGSEGALDFSSPTVLSHQDEVLSTMSPMEQSPRNPVRTEVKYIDKPQRRITEIRIFFDDQTWESFVPKK